MRINWFSPLPPARSGIAEYSACLLPVLARRTEVVAWTDQPGPVEVPPGVEVVRYGADVDWATFHRADLTCYHLGNHPGFHGAMWELSRRAPGLVVLHDARLQHLLFGFQARGGDQAATYQREMRRHYGAEAVADAFRAARGELAIEALALRYPLAEWAIDGAFAAVVHAHEAFELARRGAGCPVALLPLAFEAGPPADLPRDPRRIVVFGNGGANRLLEPFLEAFAAFDRRAELRVAVVGELADPAGFDGRRRALGLGGLVERPGRLDDAALARALATAGLVVNLRHPTMGEASYSQLRAWAAGAPTLVADAGWYGELPADAAAKVRPDHLAADLHRHFAALLDAPDAVLALGRRGREVLLADHRPEAYVDALLGFAARAAARTNPPARRYLADRVAGAWVELGVPRPPAGGVEGAAAAIAFVAGGRGKPRS